MISVNVCVVLIVLQLGNPLVRSGKTLFKGLDPVGWVLTFLEIRLVAANCSSSAVRPADCSARHKLRSYRVQVSQDSFPSQRALCTRHSSQARLTRFLTRLSLPSVRLPSSLGLEEHTLSVPMSGQGLSHAVRIKLNCGNTVHRPNRFCVDWLGPLIKSVRVFDHILILMDGLTHVVCPDSQSRLFNIMEPTTP